MKQTPDTKKYSSQFTRWYAILCKFCPTSSIEEKVKTEKIYWIATKLIRQDKSVAILYFFFGS